ncbi:MG2 domain-containing protein [Legionella spiritensis]|uniref:Alpha-2-macroglobulin n=1 Tax=Legionella spiritensis TaxID=452 RepID=A0A0W0ZAT9_LEGSP|nr:MG2 domain-containing protein [Legionella spiritensis]KTD66268.1 hypothetical protein Lspi_0031 [Legionella spiritensis]SNV48406.1 Alpha-2-macroglobulin [Legionella spiritensis]
MKKNRISWLLAAIGSFLAPLTGRVQWKSPPWFKFLRKKARKNPKQFLGAAAGLGVVLLGLVLGYVWYKNLPQPLLITAKIAEPQITPNQDELVAEPLVIDFGLAGDKRQFTPSSVAPLNEVGKVVTDNIEIKPAIAGQWRWESDSRLIFTPARDWPPGQRYEINFGVKAFADSSKIASLSYTFSTRPFKAAISKFTLYQDTVNPKNRQAVATVEFNFPVDTTSFESKTNLKLQALQQGKLDSDAPPYQFKVTYDKHKRVAYLRSENLQIPEVSRYVLLTVPKDVKSASGTAETLDTVSKNLLIPDQGSYFKVLQTGASIVRNDRDQPEQVLTLETSLGVMQAQLNKHLHVYLLPENYPATKNEREIKHYQWQNPGEITAGILALSTPLTKSAIPADRNYATLHSYKFKARTPRYIYLKLDKGVKSFGDFVLSQDYAAVIAVPEFPREINFLHKGALLALTGEKKLSVAVRGLPAVKFDIARVLPDNINQLVTQSEGDFNNPYFLHTSFNQQNISRIFSETQSFDNSDLSRQQYSALDLGRYVAHDLNSKGPRGLFLLQATGWDVENNVALDVKAGRLILITDMALIVKDNSDKSHDVFVQSITTGLPVANAMVRVLGKNGLPLLTRFTDQEGRVSFPPLQDFTDEREPVVYLANFAGDVSFIPYSNYGRQLNYSRYDVGGLYSGNQEQHRLSAFLFSDRGIYRPGDEAHVGLIVKQTFAQPQPAGLPLEMTVSDPRGTTILDQKFTLNASGYMSFNIPTTATSPTGQYFVNLYLVKDNQADSLLGSTTLRVAEFQPDRMRIAAEFSQKKTKGWLSPDALQARVNLWNLYGAPAANRRVSANLLLAPQDVAFDEYPDYRFVDPLVDDHKPAKVFTDNLAEAKTNDEGQADFDLGLNRFQKATYKLTFFAEGFEAEGGRSVTTQLTALVSPLPYLIGYKPDGELRYINQGSARSIHYIAVNSQLNQQAVRDLKIQLHALHPVTTLVKNPDGTYQYQSVIKSTLIRSQPFSIGGQGTNYSLPTDEIGDFSLSVVDDKNTRLSQARFSVVGASQLPLPKNAELTVKLDKTEYRAGEDIALHVTAPYTGAGLITIERDKVYASQWFRADTTSSVQTIRIPADFQGNGYVNIAFVRNWDSPEIFISPLSFSVVPFTVSHEDHAIAIELKTAKRARPGEALTMVYKTDKPAKIIVFAVDEGILQVAGYQTPDPLAFFFQKRALEVLTQQTVDQILPKYLRDRELSAVGGDEGEAMLARHLNPFKRKTDLPVAYWSGVLESDATPRQLRYQVPDYFNGTLTVMAVAAAFDAIGSASVQSQIRGHFVINPNVPTFVAPGDEFEVTASIANNLENSGDVAEIDVQLLTSPELELISDASQSLTIGEGKEKTVRYTLRARSQPGSATITLVAKAGDKSGKMEATLSVRPATPFLTTLKSGKSDHQKTLAVDRKLYPQYRTVEANAANSPLILVSGLQRYLDNFPYGCTEQLTSRALLLLAMAGQPWFHQDEAEIREKLALAIQMLGQRQMSSGGFSYWPGLGANRSNDFATVYAMQFLTEAKAQGVTVPGDLFYAGIGYLKEFAGQNPRNLEHARLQAYAIYVLTRNEMVTTNYLTNLQLYLDKEQDKLWQEDITGAYVAASYQLLKSEEEASRLIEQYKSSANAGVSDFYNKNIADAQYLYLIARHFPNHLAQVGKDYVMPLVNAINSGEMNTVLAGYTSMALNAYSLSVEPSQENGLTITEILANDKPRYLTPNPAAYQSVTIDGNAKNVVFNGPKGQDYFYQLIQAGFDAQPPAASLQQGLEVYREYRNAEGDVITKAELGKDIEVHIQIRAMQDQYFSNVAVVDLLPGGFEVVADSVDTSKFDYVDIREDRVVFFMGVGAAASEIVYRIKATNSGDYTVPPVLAQSMYNPNVQAYGKPGQISVTNTD